MAKKIIYGVTKDGRITPCVSSEENKGKDKFLLFLKLKYS